MTYDSLRTNVTQGANRSKSMEMLKEDERRDVLHFVQWLQSDTNFTTNTINSYKSYVCKALIKMQSGAKLTNDEKSASRKFLSFLDTLDK